MKNANKYLYILCFLIINFCIAQQNPSFFVEIPNSTYIPVITYDINGNKINSSKTGNKSLDNIINSYEIYDNKKVFKSSNRTSLQNIYLIECNDIQLMSDLKNNFIQFYPRLENANADILNTPNDFGVLGGYTGTDQQELKYIRAEEAWNITTGDSTVIIGIADTNFRTIHEDLSGRVAVVYGNNSQEGGQHGTRVASLASAKTNNGIGMSAIGYHSKILAAAYSRTEGLDTLSLLGAKVVNASWYFERSASPPDENGIYADIYDEIINDRNVVVVAAAGNGNPNSTDYYSPASLKDVISVSGIGHQNETFTYSDGDVYEVFLDHHQLKKNGVWRSHQHNDSIDIVAPSYGLLVANRDWGQASGAYVDNGQGTSFASPMVAGTVALMFDVNFCLEPKEIESILKLTAVKIDTLPQNIAFHGKLGAGKLDAYEAVKMADDMAQPFGTVEVKDRILYKSWFYKLETAPYEIKMTNNDVSVGAKVKFRARNNIEILSGDYYPSNGGYIDLQIDENLVLNDCPPPVSYSQQNSNSNGKEIENKYVIFPTLVENDVSVEQKNKRSEGLSSIKIFNFFGIEVYRKDKIEVSQITLSLSALFEGIYILKVYDTNGEILHTQKIVKK